MYTQIDLYGGATASVKTSDLPRLKSPLEKLTSKLNQLGGITPEISIDALIIRGGMVLGQVLNEERVPYNVSEFRSNEVHLSTSLLSYGAGGLYERLDPRSGERREIFQSTQRYFKDVFLLQWALTLESQKPKPDAEYLAQLRAAFERITKDGQYQRQRGRLGQAFAQLKATLHIPPHIPPTRVM